MIDFYNYFKIKSLSSSMKLTNLISRSFSNVRTFDTFKSFKNHIDKAEPNLCVMYFTANWNPKYPHQLGANRLINKLKNYLNMPTLLITSSTR